MTREFQTIKETCKALQLSSATPRGFAKAAYEVNHV